MDQIYAIFLLAVVTKLLVVAAQMNYLAFIHSQVAIKLEVLWENPKPFDEEISRGSRQKLLA